MRRSLLAAALVLVPSLALAHPGLPGHTHDLATGFVHPFGGIDHVLAMVAVGLFAAQLGGRALWLVPASFVTAMAAAGLAGMNGVALPMTEVGIAASIAVLGGAIALRLARLGFRVTLLDASQPMLDFARRAAQEAGVAEKITLKLGDAGQLATLFPLGSFDLILCHNVLEFVDHPRAVLRSAARALRGPSGMLSVLVRNQPGEVLKAALLNGDLAGAERNLTAVWGDESLYGGTVRLFTAENLKAMLQETSFAVIAQRGVRVMSDYLPLKVSRTDEYERIFELERKLGSRLEFAALARYVHCIAHRLGGTMEGGE